MSHLQTESGCTPSRAAPADLPTALQAELLPEQTHPLPPVNSGSSHLPEELLAVPFSTHPSIPQTTEQCPRERTR